MGSRAGRCKISTPYGIFIVTPSLEEWPTKAKEVPSPHEVRLSLLDTNPVFQCLEDKSLVYQKKYCILHVPFLSSVTSSSKCSDFNFILLFIFLLKH